MSSTKEDYDGCSCLVIITLVVVAILALTKPSEADHRRAIAEKTPITRALFGVQELVSGAELKYHDYFFVSIMTAKFDKSGREMPVSYGFFGKVYYGNDK